MVFRYNVLIPESLLDAVACVDSIEQGLERVKAVYEFRDEKHADPA